MSYPENAPQWDILLVDEKNEDYLLASGLLAKIQGISARLDWATAYQEGYEKACSSQYHAILIGIDSDAATGLRLIQECSQKVEAPFILITGRESEALKERAAQVGAMACVAREEVTPALFEQAMRFSIQRKQYESNLRHREQHLREIMESETSTDMIISCKPDGSVDYVNPLVPKYLGMHLDEINRVGWQAFTHPDDQGRLIERWAEAAEKVETVEAEVRLRKFNGSYQWFSVHGWPVKNRSGQIVKWVSVLRDISEQKRTEEALRASRRRTMEILESITDGFFELDTEYKFTYVNHLAAHTVGHEPGELIGKTIWEMFPAILGTEQERLYRLAMEARKPVHMELHGVLTDRWFEYRIYPSAAGITVYWTDIGERKQAEAALHASDERERARAVELQAIIDAVPAYIWITHDRDASVMIGNRAAYSLVDVDFGENISKTGADPEKVRRFRAMKDGEDIPPEELPVQMVARTGVPLVDYEFEIEINGQTRHLLGNVSPLLDKNGQPAGAVSAFIDITDRKKIEARLRESESRFRVTLSSGQITVYTTDCDLRITWMHDPHPGFDYQTAIGKRVDELLPENTTRELIEIQKQVVNTGESASGEFTAWIENQEITYDYTIAPIFDESKKVAGLACAGYDISDRKRAERVLEHYAQELERSNQALQDFSSIASHDLQEPLRKIQAFGKMLADRFGEELGVEGRDYIDRMTSASSRMNTMLQSLLAFSRVTSRAVPFEEVNLREIAQEVLTDLEVRLMQTGGNVELGEMPTIQADPMQMRQLLQNLIGNALKYHRNGTAPAVNVSCRHLHKNTVEISVSDNGIGFDMKYAGHIFDPFVRLSGKAGVEGAGMGLTICKKIVDRHGGKISVESAPGQGATFKVMLPVKQK